MGWFKKRKKEVKDSRTARILFSGSSGAVWSEQNFESYAKEAYLKNIIAFRCIDMIAKDVSSVPWELFRNAAEGKRELVTDHYVVDLLKRPNPTESLNFLILKLISFLVLSGNSFLEKVTAGIGGNFGDPKELYVLRPDRMHIGVNTSTGALTSYTYALDSRSIIWKVGLYGECDILHFKNFHPLNDFWGASAIQPASREIDILNEATEWNKSILENEGRPGMIYTVVGNMTDVQWDRFEKQLEEEHSGAKNAGKHLVVEGEKGTSITPYGWNPAEMDFLEGGREVARRVAYGFGVPPQLIGIPGDSTYSNYKEARLAFWESTVFYYLNFLKGELNNWFFKEDDGEYFLDYDLTAIPALASKVQVLWDRVEKATFLTTNKKREIVGYERIEDEIADKVMIPANYIPLESTDIDMDEGLSDEEEETVKKIMDTGYTRDEALTLIGGE